MRRYLTIIPQDPTILSGTLRSTLDVFNEYEDHEIYEALRRVHLIAAEGSEEALKLNADGDEVGLLIDRSSSVGRHTNSSDPQHSKPGQRECVQEPG